MSILLRIGSDAFELPYEVDSLVLQCSQAAQRQIAAETAKQQLQATFSAFGLRTCWVASSTLLAIDMLRLQTVTTVCKRIPVLIHGWCF